MVLDTLLTGVVGAWAGAICAHPLAVRRERRREERKAQRRSARDLASAMLELGQVIHRSGDVPVNAGEVVPVLNGFQAAWDRQAHGLPATWQHLRQSINSALGEHLGPVGWSNQWPSRAEGEISELDPVWWENADRYLDYATTCVQRWETAAGRRPRGAPLDFDAWLRVRAARRQRIAVRFGLPRLFVRFAQG